MEIYAYHQAGTVTERARDKRAALVALVTNRSMGGKLKMRDLIPRLTPTVARGADVIRTKLDGWVASARALRASRSRGNGGTGGAGGES